MANPPGQIQEILFIGISPIPILIAALIKIFGEESL
jgi:hypothetical protein